MVHPGSRFLRIGKASDVFPVTVANVIARKTKHPLPEPGLVEGITRPRKRRQDTGVPEAPEASEDADEYTVSLTSDDPVCTMIFSLIANDLISTV